MRNLESPLNKAKDITLINKMSFYSSLILSLVGCSQNQELPLKQELKETKNISSQVDFGLSKIENGIILNSLHNAKLSLEKDFIKINNKQIHTFQENDIIPLKKDKNTSSISVLNFDNQEKNIELRIIDKNKDVWNIYLSKENTDQEIYLPSVIIDKTGKNFSFDSNRNIRLNGKYILQENYKYITADKNTFVLMVTESTVGFILDFRNHDTTTEKYLLKLNEDGTYKEVSIG